MNVLVTKEFQGFHMFESLERKANTLVQEFSLAIQFGNPVS
jgi:hypothetical protein